VMPGESEPAVAVAWLAFAGEWEGDRAFEVMEVATDVAPVVAALVPGAREDEGPVPSDDPLTKLATAVTRGTCDAVCWDTAPFPVRRTLVGLMAPVLLPPDPVLAAWLSDPDMVVRTEAARYLVRGTSEPRMLALLQDPEQGVRLAAARSLAESGDPMALEPLATMLRDAGMEEKLSVLDGMLQLPANPFLPLAIEAATDEAGLVREAAIGPVTASCGDGVEAFLLERLTDEDPHVVLRAAAGLYLTVGGREEEGEGEGNGEGEGERSEGADQ